MERQQVRELAPEAIVIRLPDDPMDYARAVRDCPWFERLTLSEEDRQRGDYYAAQRTAWNWNAPSPPRKISTAPWNRWRKSRAVNPQTLARVSQLTQKTNQFNLTTRRYTEQQIAGMAASPRLARVEPAREGQVRR